MRRANDEEVAALRANPEAIADFLDSSDAHQAGRMLDLDKEWHAVHFMLTGAVDVSDGPLDFILGNFEQIGPDNGYGPASFVSKDRIAQFHHALAARSDEEWARLYDADAAVEAQIYIAETLQEEGDEALEFLKADVTRLRAFVAEAVEAGDNAFAHIT